MVLQLPLIALLSRSGISKAPTQPAHLALRFGRLQATTMVAERSIPATTYCSGRLRVQSSLLTRVPMAAATVRSARKTMTYGERISAMELAPATATLSKARRRQFFPYRRGLILLPLRH